MTRSHLPLVAFLSMSLSAEARTIYVNDDASGLNSGGTWETHAGRTTQFAVQARWASSLSLQGRRITRCRRYRRKSRYELTPRRCHPLGSHVHNWRLLSSHHPVVLG